VLLPTTYGNFTRALNANSQMNTESNQHPPAATQGKTEPVSPARHRRRPRYAGSNPRRYEEKYKEHAPQLHAETVAKVIASGKTPAGTHRPIMVKEILEVLAPQPGAIAADCTLGYGGHAESILPRLLPVGRLMGLDVDPLQLPRTEARLRGLGFGPEVLSTHRSNFAGLPGLIAKAGLAGLDIILADLGVSSMQIDDPSRGFSVKQSGLLDMRMNPQRGQSASEFLAQISGEKLAEILAENSDEPRAQLLAETLAGKTFLTTTALSGAVRAALPRVNKEDQDSTVRRVFQALRIEVNDEFSALETFLRFMPQCLNPGARVAILTFHSGEDRRVKKAFAEGFRAGIYSAIAHEVIRPSPEERFSNPRSSPAKLRWAIRVASNL
jgi:16S rRNA (cytosine1402-N4)-methyltransferase